MAETATLGVIGAGVAGCALAASLRRRGWSGPIGLWEAGRGPGGRAASRRSRHDEALVIDHGAPLFNIATAPAPSLLAPLRAGGWIEPWTGIAADLGVEGKLRRPSGDPLLAGELWHGCGGMDRVAHGLLELAEACGPVERHWGHRVRQLERGPGGGWALLNEDGEELAEVDWLVLSGSLLAHPRASALLGWPQVPLRQVAATAGDPQLQRAVAAIGAIGTEGRSNLLLVVPASRAQPWRELPFQLLACDREAQAVGGVVSRWLGEAEATAGLAVAQRQLMRWGAAFPIPPGLPAELQLCPASRIGFCGDFVEGSGFGRVEGALRSAEALAVRLAARLAG